MGDAYYNSTRLGKQLKKLRKINNMTQQDLAELLLVSVDSISLYETGKVTLGHDYIAKLCRTFNISADYFYFAYEGSLHSKENELLKYYNRLTPEEQERALGIVKLSFPHICV